MRQNLLACYTEFADILKQMSVTHVSHVTSCDSNVTRRRVDFNAGVGGWRDGQGYRALYR